MHFPRLFTGHSGSLTGVGLSVMQAHRLCPLPLALSPESLNAAIALFLVAMSQVEMH